MEPYGASYILDSLGWVYFKKGDYKQAFNYLEKAASGNHRDPVIYEHFGDAAMKVKKYRAAVGAYENSLRVHPANPQVLQQKLNQARRLLRDALSGK